MKMQNAEMEFIQLDAGDVIATSGPSGELTITFANFFDGKSGNATVIASDGTVIYDTANNIRRGYANRLNVFFGTNSITTTSYVSVSGMSSWRICDLVNQDSSVQYQYNVFNTVFKWVEEKGQFEENQ